MPEAAEVIIVNSHDGTSVCQLFAGVLRFVWLASSISVIDGLYLNLEEDQGLRSQSVSRAWRRGT